MQTAEDQVEDVARLSINGELAEQKPMASKRPRNREDGTSAGSPWRAPGAKRRCCCLPDPELTLKEFMEKLNHSDLQMVQNLCKKYDFDVPQPSVSSRAPKYRFSFRNKLPDTIFTDRKIKADNSMVEIVILDASNKIVNCGPLASAEVQIFVLDGDFNGDEHEQWANEDYTKHMVYPRKDKRPLLIGNLYVKLHDGIGCISDVKFTDNSSWMKSKTFRLGVKQCAGTEMVEEVRAGVSNAFRVKDRHGESNQKDYPPSMKDEVCCLKGIFKNGTFHKKLLELGIKTVADFLNCCNDDPENLRSIIQMPRGAWEKTLNHAIESKEICSNTLNCLANFHPYQDPLEITGWNSLWTSNVSDEYCEPPISVLFPNGQSQAASSFSFSSTKSSKAVHITEGIIAEQLDISAEFLTNGKERSYVHNNFGSVSQSSPRLWRILIFVARWKIAALRTRKNKFLANNLSEKHADVLSYSNENEPSWGELLPIICLSPL